jgi:hypothetical protein
MKLFDIAKERIAQIRQQLNVPLYRNIAIARIQVSDDLDELIAISGQTTRSGTIGLPQKPLFVTFEFPPGHSRAYDSEYKILEDVASRYNRTPGIQGNIDLFTERPPCDSCRFVIEQFTKRFPNISLKVEHGEVV